MIKITRVDERLVHGQVAFAWTNSLGADCILVVNDEAAVIIVMKEIGRAHV